MVQTNYYKMKRLFVSLFAFSLLFISCESDSETLNSSTVKVESTTAVSARTSNFEENLDLFAINHIKISDEISNLINQNKNVDLSNIPYESLENSRNEFDLKTDLENAGVINADLLIVAFKKQVENKVGGSFFLCVTNKGALTGKIKGLTKSFALYAQVEFASDLNILKIMFLLFNSLQSL